MEVNVKKIRIGFLVLALLLAVTAVTQDLFTVRWVFTNSKGANHDQALWSIKGTAADTSAVFDLFPYMSFQYCFNDKEGAEDSLKLSIVFQTSLSPTVDSTWANAATIESSLTTPGWRPVAAVAPATAAYGRIIVTGLTGNDKTTANTGWIRTCSWSNQPIRSR
jgi:hypothetical protein